MPFAMKIDLPRCPLSNLFSPAPQSQRHLAQKYLLGLRGILTVQTFLFIFFQTFVPVAVADSKNTTGLLYQTVLRKTLSVIFWNDSLIYSFVVLLSARTICLPFLLDPSRTICASSLFRRNIRLWLPTFIAFSFSAAAFSTASTQYITDFLTLTGNISTTTPLHLRNFLVYFNSLFDIFWVAESYSSQAANMAFPSGMLWIVSLLYQQSYTVYMTMVIVPYTRASWRVKAMLIFILAAWWVQSWAWYSITGLLLADAKLNMNLQSRSRTGFRLGIVRVPPWLLYGLVVVTGVALQYLFIAWRPDFRNKELQGHTGLYTSGSLNTEVDESQPQARDDDYLIIVGVMLLVETYDGLQNVLRSRILVGLGNRSFSVFLVSPILVYTAGIKLYLRLYAMRVSHEVVTLLCFVVCVPLVLLAAELFYRFVDVPSTVIAKEVWAWMCK